MQAHARPTLTHREGRALLVLIYRELREQGLTEPVLGALLLKLAVLGAALACALGLAWFGRSWLEVGAGHAALVLVLAQLAFVGHDAGHGSLARGASVNRALGQGAMTLATGLAFDEWIDRHLAHHRHCQDATRDPDMSVSVVVSLTTESKAEKGAFGRFMTRHQTWHVWWLSFVFGHSQRHSSQLAALRAPRTHALDVAVVSLHFALWLIAPSLLGASAGRVLATYLVPVTLLGPYLAAIFWVNHVGMPLIADPDRFSFVERQSLTSRTILGPPAWRWVFGGLDFQIEHHLFPRVAASRLPAVQAIVRRHFAASSLPYNGTSWTSAVRAIAAHFRTIARGP